MWFSQLSGGHGIWCSVSHMAIRCGGAGCQPAHGWLSGPNGRGQGLGYDLEQPPLSISALGEFRTIKQALTTLTEANRALKPHPGPSWPRSKGGPRKTGFCAHECSRRLASLSVQTLLVRSSCQKPCMLLSLGSRVKFLFSQRQSLYSPVSQHQLHLSGVKYTDVSVPPLRYQDLMGGSVWSFKNAPGVFNMQQAWAPMASRHGCRL